jgi:hypothetical protein
MSGPRRIGILILGTVLAVMLSQSAQGQTPQPTPPAFPYEHLAARLTGRSADAEPAKPVALPAKGPVLKLTGLTLTVPEGWVEEKVEPTPMGPKAIYRIPKLDAAGPVDRLAGDGMVRITHYPNMKGKDKDDMNIDRWLGQVSKPDGKPLTRADAKITTTEAGPVRLTVVDMSGSAKLTMKDTATPNQRMIAAIVDHPQGPHFVVAVGPAPSMEKWAAQIDAFLKSAKVE